jgi:ketosteroid isomerase-like protein
MSREDLAALHRIYEGWAVGNVWAEASLYDPHVVYISQAGDPSRGPHYGLEAFTAYTRSFLESWDNWRIEGTNYRQAGDTYVVQIRRTALCKGSGVPIEDQAFHVSTFRGGRVIRLEVFERESDALEAAGLRE